MIDLEPNDPINDLSESTAQLLAFVYRQKGEAGARELLKVRCGPVPEKTWLLPQSERLAITTKEQLEKDVSELEKAGTKTLADIVRQFIKGRPSVLDVPPYEPGSLNHASWLASMKRRKK